MSGCSYTVLSHACTPAHAALGIIRKYSGIPTAVGSQPSFFSIFFMLQFKAVRCVTEHMHSSYFATPCCSAMTTSLLYVNPQVSEDLLMDRCLDRQHSWMLYQLQTNATSFLGAPGLSSPQSLWKGWHIYVYTGQISAGWMVPASVQPISTGHWWLQFHNLILISTVMGSKLFYCPIYLFY